MEAQRRREEESSLRGYEHEFERAAEDLRTAAASKRVFVSDPQKIKLYALFKQATEGDCAKPQPSAFQPVERAKWNGWQSLHGMDATVAKRRYVLQVIELVPSFKMPTEEQVPNTSTTSVNSAEQPVAGAQAGAQVEAEPRAPPPSQQEAASVSTPVAPPVRQSPSSAHSRPAAPTRPRQQHQSIQLPQRRLKQPVEASSYGAIFLQIVLFVALVTGFLFVSIRVALPFCHDLIAQHFGEKSSRAVMKSLTPVFWFALGYLFVAAIRSRIFSWRLLSGEFVWLTMGSPRSRLRSSAAASRLRRQRRRAGRRAEAQSLREPPKSPTTLLLEKFDIQVIEASSASGEDSSLVTPRLEVILPENPDATRFGDSVTIFPFPLEQTAEVYYRKFKEPLPDPESPKLLAITLLEEHRFDEYAAVFRRRKIQFKNNAPYLMKRQFASSDFVEYIEDSLLDKRNRIFYVYTKNESFQSFGTIEDYSVYRVAGDDAQWTELSQGARLHISNSSIGFFRSKLESMVSASYAKNIPRSREYHLERLCEEFGPPAEIPVSEEGESSEGDADE